MTEVLLHENLWHIRVNRNEHLGDVNSTLCRGYAELWNPTASGLYPMKDGLALVVVAVESFPAIPEIPSYGSGRTEAWAKSGCRMLVLTVLSSTICGALTDFSFSYTIGMICGDRRAST
jgi:hypothetical protein